MTKHISVYILIFLFLLFIGSGIVVNPFFGEINLIDEGQFGAWITHMIRGEYLYKDIYAAYGPFYIYPVFLFAKLFGQSVFLIRVVYLVINTFLAILIATFVLRKLEVRFPLQLFVIALLLIVPAFGMRQGIGFLALLLCFVAYEKKQKIWSVMAGLSLTIAFLISSEMGIFVSVITLSFFTFTLITIEHLRSLLTKYCIVFISALITFFLFFLWSNHEGWFFDYLYVILDDLVTYSGINLPIGMNFPNALELIPSSFSPIALIRFFLSRELLLYWIFIFYIFSFIFLLVKLVLRLWTKRDILVAMLCVYGLFLALILIGRSGHLPFVLSPLFILCGFYLDQLVTLFSKVRNRFDKIAVSLLSLLLILYCLRIVSLYRPHFPKILTIPQTFHTIKYSPNFVGYVAIPPVQSKQIRTIQGFILNNTRPDEPVFFFNNEPMMYLFVNRDNPTRYDLPEVASIKEKRLEIVDDLEKHKPKFIIDDSSAWAPDGISNWRRLPEVSEYIKKNYTKSQLENFIIYTRKGT